MRRNYKIIRLSTTAILIALYFLFSKFSININNLIKISFTGVVLIYAGTSLSFYDSLFIVFSGELLNQVFSEYGISITTPIWMIPPILRLLPISITRLIYKSREKNILDDKKVINFVIFYLVNLFGSLLNSGANSLAIYLDGLILNYPTNLTVSLIFIRFGISIINFIICTSLSIPLIISTKKIISSFYNEDN